MNEILLVNPRKRRASKKRRSPAQKAATRKLVARNRRRKNPAAPGSRRKVTRRKARRAVASAPARRRRYKRNPTVSRRNITGLVQTAAAGAGGAIALDVALAYLPLPAMLKSGIVGKVTKAAGAIALGVVAQKTGLVKSTTARDMTVGALTVQLAGIGRELLGQFAPGVALSAYLNEDYAGELGYAGSGWNPSEALSWGGGMNAYNVGSGYDVAAPGDGAPGLDAYESEGAFGW